MDSSAWSALGTWFTALIYILLLIYAVRQVGEAKKLRTAQTRPFVIVDFEPEIAIFLYVANVGSTMARNVKFKFDPPLASTLDKPWPVAESPLLNKGATALPPGRRHRILYDVSFRRLADDDLPRRHMVDISYSDDFGNRYHENYELDLGVLMHTSPGAKGLPDLVSEVESIRKELARWTDGSSGLLVHGRDKDRMDEDQQRWIQERFGSGPEAVIEADPESEQALSPEIPRSSLPASRLSRASAWLRRRPGR
jgi:hypothetical protein